MIKTRIIPILLYKNFTLVKGVRFDSWRRVGSLLQAIKVYRLREVDELIFLDISATQEGRSPDFRLVDDFADECLMPLTVGGGVRKVEDVKTLLRCGADKVAINSAAFEEPEMIREAARKFGSQCIVISIDFKRSADGKHEVFIHSGTKPTGKEPILFAKEVEQLGAGEILLTSIDRDGTMEGYDTELIQAVADAVSIPVIASGGAGSYDHMLEVLVKGKASAVAAASIYHFTQMTPLETKHFLREKGIQVRI
ncbi:MAG: glycosyl amidation-associated protein WbuZ [Deltaproteobacteria bacterium]|nr:glycosyl amidation-associated protein WbuZ [Deltaproteobacteria bacterium]